MKIVPAAFEGQNIRRIYDEKTETWLFSVVDIIQVLTQQPDFQAARNYWKVLKNRLQKEGSQSVTNCNRLKLPASDGKNYLTDVANPETLLRLVQSVPSPKAEPIKLWLAKVGYEQMQESSPVLREVQQHTKLHRVPTSAALGEKRWAQTFTTAPAVPVQRPPPSNTIHFAGATHLSHAIPAGAHIAHFTISTPFSV